MNEHHRELPLIRSTEQISRRDTFLTLVALALLGANVEPVDAKRGKHGNRKSKRKPQQNSGEACPAQVVECREMVFVVCRDRDDPAACEAPSLPCCEPLATCDATSMLDCLFNVTAAVAS